MGSVCLGFPTIWSCGFELISQEWAKGTRRLVSAMACSRFLRSGMGILMYGHVALNSFLRPQSTAPTDKVV